MIAKGLPTLASEIDYNNKNDFTLRTDNSIILFCLIVPSWVVFDKDLKQRDYR